MLQRRRNRLRITVAQPIVNRYTQARRNQPRAQRNTLKNNVSSSPKPSQLVSIIAWIKNANIGNLSSQLHTIADHMGTFGQMAGLMKQLNGLGGSSFSGNSGGGFSLSKLLQDNNSITNLIQAMIPNLGAMGAIIDENSEPIRTEPIRVEPISVETHPKKD